MRVLHLWALLATIASCEKATPSDSPVADRPGIWVVVGDRHPRAIDEAEAKSLFLTGLEDTYPQARMVRVIRCTPLDRLRWECAGYAIAGSTLIEQAGIVVGTTEPDVATRSR